MWLAWYVMWYLPLTCYPFYNDSGTAKEKQDVHIHTHKYISA